MLYHDSCIVRMTRSEAESGAGPAAGYAVPSVGRVGGTVPLPAGPSSPAYLYKPAAPSAADW